MKPLILSLALCLSVFANEEDKKALRELRMLYETSVAAGNLEALKPHLAADFTAVMITAEEVEGFDGILEYWGKVQEFIGEGGTYEVSIDPDDSIFEGNVAIAKGKALEKVKLKNGKNLEFTSLWTAVARKEDGTWKLVRIHAAIDPVANPIIAFLNRAKMWIQGGVGLVVGMVAGLLICRRMRG